LVSLPHSCMTCCVTTLKIQLATIVTQRWSMHRFWPQEINSLVGRTTLKQVNVKFFDYFIIIYKHIYVLYSSKVIGYSSEILVKAQWWEIFWNWNLFFKNLPISHWYLKWKAQFHMTRRTKEKFPCPIRQPQKESEEVWWPKDEAQLKTDLWLSAFH
jgi:hypothetical protein